MQRITPENITSLKPKEIIVFGSNTMGLHGKGLAKQCLEQFGAIPGVAEGKQGRCYAIPTRSCVREENHQIRLVTLPISEIMPYVSRFIRYADIHHEYSFLITKIGTGLAGIPVDKIAILFEPLMDRWNVSLPREFVYEIRKYLDNKYDT